MAFQSTVRTDQTTGIAGEISNEGPVRAQPWNLDSSASGQLNTIGNVFTKLSDGVAHVGNPAPTGAFIGILALPKDYALFGTSGDALAPVFDLANFQNGELVDMGIMFIDLQTAGDVGDDLTYDIVTGVISSAVAVPVDAANFAIPNAKIIEQDIPTAGLAKIQLTN